MNNVRKLRNAENLTIRDLADRMGIHFTTVARIERSAKPMSNDWIMRFAEALGVEPHEIADSPFAKTMPNVRMAPVIGLVAAGMWREAVQSTDEYIATPATGRQVFGLRVSGESMNKIAQDGSTVMVDPEQLHLLDGKFYVVMNDEGEATFKQYRSNPARLEPLSDVPGQATLMLGQTQFTVVGMVVGVYQSFV